MFAISRNCCRSKCYSSCCLWKQRRSALCHSVIKSCQKKTDYSSSATKWFSNIAHNPQRHTCVPFVTETVSSAQNVKQYSEFVECFSGYGIGCDMVDNMLLVCPQLKQLSVKEVQSTLESWASCQLGEKNLINLITTHPELVFAPSHLIRKRFVYFSSIFSESEVYNIFLNSPNVLTENIDLLEEKLHYLENVMFSSKRAIAKHGALGHSIDHIKERHLFLNRAGIFKTPTKNLPQLNNPTLNDMFNTPDNIFSTKVAKMTNMEFELFKELLKVELSE